MNTIDHTGKIKYNTGVKYLLSRNDTAYKINQNIKNKISEPIDKFHTIDYMDKNDNDIVSKENEILLTSVLNKLKNQNYDDEYFDYENKVFVMRNNKTKLFLPERMNQLKGIVELKLGDPYLYLNKNMRNDILSHSSLLSNIFNKNIKNYQKLNTLKKFELKIFKK